MPAEAKITSSFCTYLLEHNRDLLPDFKNWTFHEGMLFEAGREWWGRQKPRRVPHEGVDFCCFENAAGEVVNLNGPLKIPAAFAGTIVKISRDYLGKSLFIAHEIFSESGSQLYTFYGHTNPGAAMAPGRKVAAGEIIAVVASPTREKTAVLPHLHISLAWLPRPLPLEHLDWRTMARDGRITFVDPLAIFEPISKLFSCYGKNLNHRNDGNIRF